MVGNSKLANGIPSTSGIGRLVVASQPRASVHGTRILSILTDPDSVRRSPTLSLDQRRKRKFEGSVSEKNVWWLANMAASILSFFLDDEEREREESLHLPVMRELDSRLIGLDQCEDVIFRAIEDTFENSEIAHHTCELSKERKKCQ